MAVDPKVIGGGVAVVAIGGGSGYAISQATSSKTDQDVVKPPIYTADNFGDGKLGKALKDAKFVLLSPTKEETKWSPLVEAHKGTSADFNSEKLQNDCKTLLEKDFAAGTQTNDDFKNAVKKCTEIITFETRATSLNITTKKQSDNDWNSITSKLTSDIATKSIVDDLKPKTSSPAATADDVKKFCLDVGQLTWKEFSTTKESRNDLEAEWKNYLTVCSSQENKVTTDFWTGKLSATVGSGA